MLGSGLLVLGSTRSDILTTVDDITKTFMNQQLDTARHAAVALGGLFCMLYLAKLAVKVLNRNEPTLWDVLRPVATLFVVSTFSTTVIAPLNGIFNGAIVNPAVKKVTLDRSTIKIVRFGLAEGLKDIASGESGPEEVNPTDNGGAGGGFLGRMSDFFFRNKLSSWSAWSDFKKFIMKSQGITITAGNYCVLLTLEAVSSFLFWFLFDIIYILADVNLAILSVLGPFVFAIDILPGISGIGTWIARYIQICFWKVVIIMIGLFLTTAGADVLGAGSYDTNAKLLASMAVNLACIVAMFSVEKISGYITQSNGANGATAGAYSGMRAVFVAARKALTKGA